MIRTISLITLASLGVEPRERYFWKPQIITVLNMALSFLKFYKYAATLIMDPSELARQFLIYLVENQIS